MRSARVSSSLTTEFALVHENILIQNERITQLYVIQSEQSPFLWFGVLFVDRGMYNGSVIRFTIFIEDTYPDCTCPKVVFNPIPSHPLINPYTGELDTKNAFPNWNSNNNRLFELLLFIKRSICQADEYINQVNSLLFQVDADETKSNKSTNRVKGSQKIINIATDRSRNRQSVNTSCDSNNETLRNEFDGPDLDKFDADVARLFSWFHHTLEFYELYHNQPMELDKRVREFKEKCNQQAMERPALCGDDRNVIVFSPWSAEKHEPFRECILSGRFTPTNLFATYHKASDTVSFIPGHDSKNDT